MTEGGDEDGSFESDSEASFGPCLLVDGWCSTSIDDDNGSRFGGYMVLRRAAIDEPKSEIERTERREKIKENSKI